MDSEKDLTDSVKKITEGELGRIAILAWGIFDL